MSPVADNLEGRAAALLLGAWRLRSCEARSDSGDVTYPYGPDPAGYITYTPSEYMAVSIMGSSPPKLSDEADVLAGTARAIQAGHAYIGYAGAFRVEGVRAVSGDAIGGAGTSDAVEGSASGDASEGAASGDAFEGTVCHTLETASFPNWVGTTQRREFRLTDTTLTLTTPPIIRQGVRAIATLVWERT
jgi:hypothetical protein